jgi:chromosome segregation ATPase
MKQVKDEKNDISTKMKNVQTLIKKTEVELQSLEWNEEKVAQFLERLESQMHSIHTSITALLSSIQLD